MRRRKSTSDATLGFPIPGYGRPSASISYYFLMSKCRPQNVGCINVSEKLGKLFVSEPCGSSSGFCVVMKHVVCCSDIVIEISCRPECVAP